MRRACAACWRTQREIERFSVIYHSDFLGFIRELPNKSNKNLVPFVFSNLSSLSIITATRLVAAAAATAAAAAEQPAVVTEHPLMACPCAMPHSTGPDDYSKPINKQLFLEDFANCSSLTRERTSCACTARSTCMAWKGERCEDMEDNFLFALSTLKQSSSSTMYLHSVVPEQAKACRGTFSSCLPNQTPNEIGTRNNLKIFRC